LRPTVDTYRNDWTGECTYTVFGLKKNEQRKNEGDTHKAALPVSNSIDADTAGEGERGKKRIAGRGCS
jgi:hypothetical protein